MTEISIIINGVRYDSVVGVKTQNSCKGCDMICECEDLFGVIDSRTGMYINTVDDFCVNNSIIFKKVEGYNENYPTHCEHDEFRVIEKAFEDGAKYAKKTLEEKLNKFLKNTDFEMQYHDFEGFFSKRLFIKDINSILNE